MIPKRGGMSFVNPAQERRPDPPPKLAAIEPVVDDPIGNVPETKAVLSTEPLPTPPPRPNHGQSVTAARLNGSSGPTPTDLLTALRGYTSVTKNVNQMTDHLLKRGLVVSNGPHHVISPKGLGYLVDFGILE